MKRKTASILIITSAVVLLLLTVRGCVEDPAELYTPAPEVFRRWQQDRDYYALLQIVDTHIDPHFFKTTKKDVRKHLGPPNEPLYPHAGPKMWVYSTSTKRAQGGTYLLVMFDNEDNVEKILWASE